MRYPSTSFPFIIGLFSSSFPYLLINNSLCFWGFYSLFLYLLHYPGLHRCLLIHANIYRNGVVSLLSPKCLAKVYQFVYQVSTVHIN